MPGFSSRDIMRRLTFNQSSMITALCVLSTGLVALAAYFWLAVVDKLQFPITPGLAEAATFLPVANFAAMKYLTKKPRGVQGRPEWDIKTGIISILLVIIDTVVVTQSINNMPKSSIACPLERTWRAWYRSKDATHIKAVQDAFKCCGFNTYKDNAWPFPDAKTNPDACSIQNKTRASCYEPWSQRHQLSATVFFAVAAVTLLSKGIIFATYRMSTRNQAPITQRLLAEGPSNGSQNNGSSRAIAGLRIRPDERARALQNEDDDIESAVDENSRLLNNGETTHYETAGQLESGERPILSNIDTGVWENEYSRGNPR